MLTLWLKEKQKYDGTQLSPLSNYLNHGQLGNSVVAWQGPCDIPFEHMIDGEDLREKSLIQADEMVHFIVELFDQPLKAAVLLQRLMGELVKTTLKELNKSSSKSDTLKRSGDDLYLGDQKLNISIATQSRNSVLIHFGVNVTNKGTPVLTAALSDFEVKPQEFGELFMHKLKTEVEGQTRASQKIRTF